MAVVSEYLKLSTPVDFPQDWDDPLVQLVQDYDQAPNWKSCRQALLGLQKKLKQPSSVDYSDIVRVLIDAIVKNRKSQNTIILAASECLKSLADHLNQKFQPYAEQCLSVVLESFPQRDQKTMNALHSAADAIFRIVGIAGVASPVCQALNHSQTSIQAETAAFVTRALARSQVEEINCKVLRMLIDALQTPLDSKESSGRFNAAMAIGTVMKLIGKNLVMPLISHLNLVRIAKIEECADRAVLIPKEDSIFTDKNVSSNQNCLEKSLSTTEDCQQKSFYKSLPRGLIRDVESNHWTKRLTAFRALKFAIMDIEKSKVSTIAIVKLLCKDPGFKELDRNVLLTRFEILQHLARNFSLPETTVQLCIVAIIDILGYEDLHDVAEITLTALTEATSLQFMADEVIKFATKRNSLTAQHRALIWLSNALLEFGCTLPVNEELIANLKKLLVVESPEIVATAAGLLGVMYLFFGQALLNFFDNDVKLRALVEAELAQYAGIKPPTPTRTSHRRNELTGVFQCSENLSEVGFNPADVDGDSSVIEIVIPAEQVPKKINHEALEQSLPNNVQRIVENLRKSWPHLRMEMIITPNESENGNQCAVLRLHLNESVNIAGKRERKDYAISAEIVYDKQFKLSKLQLHNTRYLCNVNPSPAKKVKFTEPESEEELELPFDEMPLDVRVQEIEELILRPNFDSFGFELNDDEISKLEKMEIKLIHDVPPQHNLKTKGLPSSYHAEQFKKFVQRKRAGFRANERKLIMENWQKFCEIHDWNSNNPFPFMDLYSKTCPYLPNIENRLKFLQFIAKDLNNRMLHTVYIQFQKLFFTNNQSLY